MPEYRFRNKKTGKTWTEWLTFSGREEVLKDENIEQLVNGFPRIVSNVNTFGSKLKPDDEFRSRLKQIKKKNPGSTINTY